MFLIRGVLLAGKFRSQHELNTMSHDDMRNTLIVEIAGRSSQTNLQSFDNDTLAGMGALLVFLRTARIRNDAALKTMTSDDMRNTLIVELMAQTGRGRELQALSNIELVKLGLHVPPPTGLGPPSPIRGILLAGQFRTQGELNRMSFDDMRNTLIVELAKRTNHPNLQALNDRELEDAGAVMVFLRDGRIRTDGELKVMSLDEQRNTAIVEIDAQTGLGVEKLQGLHGLDLVLTALGVDPVFKSSKVPSYVFGIDSFHCRGQKSDGNHSDADWLTIIVTVGNPVTKLSRTLPPKTLRLEGAIKTGDVIAGPFETDPFDVSNGELVVVNYLVMNLGSSRAEDQAKEAGQVASKVVSTVAPIAGTVIGLFFGQPQEGLQIGQAVAKAFDGVLDTLSDVFDFLDIHAGPPNCNGEVLSDTLTYEHGDWLRAVNQPASRDYTGPQQNSRCGAAPESTLHFAVRRFHPAPFD